MRKLFVTTPNFEGKAAVVMSPNPYGEYEVRYFEMQHKNSGWAVLKERKEARSFETDLPSACSTAVSMVYGFNAARNLHYPETQRIAI